MPIPETQLDTWAYQGSITQSSSTYATIRSALLADNTGYADKDCSVFLQGSYGNDTNVYGESDVDVVISLKATYFYDIGDLSEDEKGTFQREFSPATYRYPQYKADVVAALARRFGADTQVGSKAIAIAANSGRRKTDVIVAAEFRQYYANQFASLYIGAPHPAYHRGICFFTTADQRVVNYPKQHSANCTQKHQSTGSWFKPTVRILKNLRNTLISRGILTTGVAPSYFIEGLLYNAPNVVFGQSYSATLSGLFSWLEQVDRDALICANERYYLIRDVGTNCWPTNDAAISISALLSAWHDW